MPYRSSRNRDNKLFIVFAAVVAAFIVFAIGTAVVSSTKTGVSAGCVVNDKDRTKDSNGNSDMRVYTDNCGTFSVSDSILDGTFSSADTFSKIKVGKTYDFDTRGVRVPVLSMFPNIVEVN